MPNLDLHLQLQALLVCAVPLLAQASVLMVIPVATHMATELLLLPVLLRRDRRQKVKPKVKRKGRQKPRRRQTEAPVQALRDIIRGVPSTRGRFPEAIYGVASQWSWWQLPLPSWSQPEPSPWLILRRRHDQHHITPNLITQLLKGGTAYTVETG